MAAENFKVKKGLEVGTGITANSDGVNVTGIITATQFKGDGSGLTGVVGSGSGVVIKDEGSAVGTAGTINFVGSGIAAAISEGTATVTVNAGGLDNVVEDTTPQLGGNLDLNSKFVTGSGGINVTGVVTATTLKGNGDFVDIDVDGQTEVDDLNVAGVTTFAQTIRCNSSSTSVFTGGIDFSQANVTSGNITFVNNRGVLFGSGNPFQIYHNSGASIIEHNGTGTLNIMSKSSDYAMRAYRDGGVKLYFAGNEKLTTTINGIEVPDLNVTGVGTVGRLETNGVTLGTNNNTFAAKFIDDAVANFGTDNDLKISHDDTHARITNTKGNIVVSGIISATSDVKVGSAITMDPTSGIITATSFSGSGSGLTSIPSAQLSGALPALDGSALTGITASGSGVIVKHDGSTVGTAGTINFSTNLDVSAISAGIVTVTASGSSVAGISTTGTSVFNEIVVGSGVTVNARGINAVGTALTAGRFHADGGSFQAQIGATNQGFYLYNGGNVHLGLSWSSSASINQFRGNAGGNYPLIIDDFSNIAIAPKSGAVELSFAENLKLTTDQAGVKITGICTATTFSGSGVSLTTLNASELDSGTIPNGRFPTTLPAVGGGSLTDLNATALTTGTVPTGRFGTNNISPSSISVTSSRILGRVSSGTNSAEELTAAQVRTLLNVADGATAGITTAPSNIAATWSIGGNSGDGYQFTGPGQDGSEGNPDIYLVRGQKYRFVNTTGTGHPFEFRNEANNADYTDGITGSQSGTQEFNVQHDAPAALKYRCTIHTTSMLGNIYIVGQHLANGADNRIVTATSAYGMNAEANLTYGGGNLQFNTTANGQAVILKSTGNYYNKLSFDSNNTSAGGSLAFIDFSWDGDKVSDILAVAGSDTTNKDDGHLVFRTSPAQGSIAERLRITSAGDVGISSDAPRAKLDVKDQGTGKDVILRVSADNNTPYGLVVGNDDFNTTSNRGLAMWIGANKVHHIAARTSTTANENELKISATDAIYFGTGSSETEHLRITSAGQVQIPITTQSTTTTSGALKVSGGIGVAKNIICGGALEVQNNTLTVTSAAPNILMAVPSGGLDSRIFNDGSGNLIIGHGTNSSTPTERLRINSDGYVTHQDGKKCAFNVKGTNMARTNADAYVCEFDDDSSSGCFDSGGDFNTTTHKFVAPVSGYYHFFTNIRLDAYSVGYIRTAILSTSYHAGTSYYEIPSTGHVITYPTNASNIMTVQTSTVMYLPATHEAWVYQNPQNDTSYTVYLNESSFGGYFIG